MCQRVVLVSGVCVCVLTDAGVLECVRGLFLSRVCVLTDAGVLECVRGLFLSRVCVCVN